MNPLQKSPFGLLELFRLRTLGQNPFDFGSAVAPSVDVTDFYGADLLVNDSTTIAAGVITRVNFSPAATIPRRYKAISGSLTIGAAAGTWLTIDVGYTAPPANSALPFGAVQLATFHVIPIIGATYRVAVPLGDLILPPGHQVFFESNGNAAGADHTPSLSFSYQIFDGR